MKVYFTASIKGRPKYCQSYEEIVKELQSLGHKVKADHIIKYGQDYIEAVWSSEQKNREFYKKMVGWLSEADIIVAECSYPSANVGHEITLALEKGKSVIVLYNSENRPHLLEGMDSENILVLKYDLNNLKNDLKNAIAFLKQMKDTRFTLLLPPKIVSFLNEVFEKEKIPRSVFIRKLIEKEMEKRK